MTAAAMLDHLLRFVTVGSLAIGVLAIYFAVRNNTLQLGAHIFLNYSDHVREIRRSTATRSPDAEDTAATLFLIFELFELKRRGFVGRSIWTIWDRDIVDFLNTDSFRAHWSDIRSRFRNHRHFLAWVDAHATELRR